MILVILFKTFIGKHILNVTDSVGFKCIYIDDTNLKSSGINVNYPAVVYSFK